MVTTTRTERHEAQTLPHDQGDGLCCCGLNASIEADGSCRPCGCPAEPVPTPTDAETVAVVVRAARAILFTADRDNWSFEGQTPVEDWAIDALISALYGEPDDAVRLLDQYEEADIEDRLAYISEED